MGKTITPRWPENELVKRLCTMREKERKNKQQKQKKKQQKQKKKQQK